MTDLAARRQRVRFSAWFVAAAAAAALLLLAGNRIEEQGLYYDELFQAPAAFAYVGRPAQMFNVAQIGGLPALNMNYAGAIKSAAYGLYLRAFRAPFTVRSWRWFGILVAAASLSAFCLIARRGVPAVATGLIAVLVVTDANLLLCVRTDLGGVALSLAMRLVILGLMLRRGTAGPGPSEAAGIGVLLGLIVFDKLSGAVIVVPVAAWVLVCGSGSATARMRALALGACVGALPLVWLNAQSLLDGHGLVSLGNVPAKLPMQNFARRYLRLGAGAYVQDFILGRPVVWTHIFEGYVLAIALGATVWAAALMHRLDEHRRTARQVLGLLAIWLTIGLEMPLLPSTTNVYHWILGTPFHYAAVAMLLGQLRAQAGATVGLRQHARLVTALVALLLAGRVASVSTMERHLADGAASAAFDPSFTRLGQIAAAESDEVLFVATTWGVATQIVCLSNGQTDRVVEAFWRYGPDDRLPRLLEQHPSKRVFYLVAMNRPTGAPNHRQLIERDFASSAALVEEPSPLEMAALDAVTVRRFVRR